MHASRKQDHLNRLVKYNDRKHDKDERRHEPRDSRESSVHSPAMKYLPHPERVILRSPVRRCQSRLRCITLVALCLRDSGHEVSHVAADLLGSLDGFIEGLQQASDLLFLRNAKCEHVNAVKRLRGSTE